MAEKDTYDRLIDTIMSVGDGEDRVSLVQSLWNTACPLFQKVGRHKIEDIGRVSPCGCLTQIKSANGFFVGTEYEKCVELHEEILRDPRIPESIGVSLELDWYENLDDKWKTINIEETLNAFAEWQRKIDILYDRPPGGDRNALRNMMAALGFHDLSIELPTTVEA